MVATHWPDLVLGELFADNLEKVCEIAHRGGRFEPLATFEVGLLDQVLFISRENSLTNNLFAVSDTLHELLERDNEAYRVMRRRFASGQQQRYSIYIGVCSSIDS